MSNMQHHAISELSSAEIEAVHGGVGAVVKVVKALAANPTVQKIAAAIGLIDAADLRSDSPGGSESNAPPLGNTNGSGAVGGPSA